MAADFTAYQAVMKEQWTSDSLEKQFYADHPILDTILKGSPSYSIGEYAIVPVHTGRSGGYSVVPRTGSTALNAADEQKVNQAQYTWTNHWFQVEIDESTVKETKGKPKAVADVVDTEVNGALDDLRNQVARQLCANSGDALLVQCGTTNSATTVVLANAQAITRGWLYPGLTIDIGTTADEDVIANAVTVDAVDEANGTIDISGSAVSTTSSHYVSIANARAGATSYEANGFHNMVGTAEFGGIDPATEPGWKSTVDTTAQALSLPLLYTQQRQVRAKARKRPDWIVTSLKQEQALYQLLQVQARFDGDSGIEAGNTDKVKFAGMEITADPDIYDADWFALTKKDILLLREGGPEWASDVFGGGGPLEWKQGTTRAVGGLVWHIQFGLKRRNSHAAYTGLT